jgi:hypothetical protein
MTVGGALKAALRDMYEQSWRFIVLNLALCVVVAALLLMVSFSTPALPLVIVVGPFAAALMHCAVTLQQTEAVHLSDGLAGLRLHWRRGLALAAIAGVATALFVVSVVFYAQRAWPVALFALYVALLFGVWQIHLWPLAVARGRESLRDVVRDAARALVQRPFASLGLALALLLVNGIGAIGVLPVLTLTVAYSALAAARFALPPPTEEAAGT